MNTEQFMHIALYFYIIQNVVRNYYFLSLAPLKKNNTMNKVLIYIAIIIFTITVDSLPNSIRPYNVIFDAIYLLLILHCFCEGKISTKVLYYVVSINVQLIVELINLGITTTFFQIDYTTLSSTNTILMLFIPTTFFICVLHVILAKVIKIRKDGMDAKYIVGVTLLSFTQSSLVFAQVYNFAYFTTVYIYPVLAICIIISYFLVKYIFTYIYAEYKYKENTLYFIKQYETQLKDYLKLKDSDEEIRYLRHEIMNQLLNYEHTKKGEHQDE